jgi:hypothetical protein
MCTTHSDSSFKAAMSVIKCIATVCDVAYWRFELIGMVKLIGFPLMLQAAVLNGVAFDPFLHARA